MVDHDDAHHRREQRREAEHEVLRVIAADDDLATAAPRILEAVCRLGEWDLGVLWLVSPPARRLRPSHVWHREALDLGELVAALRQAMVEPGAGLPGRVWSERSPAWVADVGHEPGFPHADLASRAGLPAALAFPIRVRDEVVGVMGFHAPALHEPDHDLLLRLEGLGGQIGRLVERTRGQRALAACEARYRLLLDQLEAAVLLVQDGQTVDCNPAALRRFGLPDRDGLIGRSLLDLSPELQPDGTPSAEALEQRVRAALAGKPQAFPWLGVRADGSRLDVEARLVALEGEEEPLLQWVLTDVGGRRQLERELGLAQARVRELTVRDPLTGVHNRRHLDAYLQVELVAARRHHQDLSVALFDVDHLRALNEAHGRAAGDAVLRALAAAIGGAIRVEDLLARYGGEEFVLVMRQTAGREARDVAERLRARIERLEVKVGESRLRFTVSAGVAAFAELAEPSDDSLLGKADERLYRAKTLGRNQVVGPG
jgi:diguanylate cyclase (GGDEF)-like protein/PAS domain S-box-containing protein